MKKLGSILLSICFAACGSDNGGDPVDGGNNLPDSGMGGCAIQSNFGSIMSGLFNTPTCNPDGSCHGPPGNGGLNFKAGNDAVHAALLADSIGAPGTKRVVPNNANDSYLVRKLTDPTAPGGRMPLGANQLPACQIDAIKGWINTGATQ
jgi:hypothetical protein